MSEPLAAAPFLVAGWVVDPRANELVRAGVTHRLEPKVMDVLVALAARAGEPVTREDLLERVWPGVFVSESALSRCVSQLRKLFDDDPRQPTVIETLSKVGYRLVAPVRPAFAGDSIDADGLPQAAADGIGPGVADVLLSLSPHPSITPRRRRRALAWALAGAAVIVAAPAAVLSGRIGRPPPAASVAPLTTTRNPETGAAPSPDGSRVAFVGSSQEEGNNDIYVQVLGDGSALRLTTDPAADMAPAWSPDGRRIAFLRCDRDAACSIESVSPLGGEPRELFTGLAAATGGLSWSPDGSTVAYAAWETGAPTDPGSPRRTGLWLLDVATGRTRRLTTPPPGVRGDGLPRFSPDGGYVAFRREMGPGFADLHVVPAAGGTPRALTDDGRFLAGHTWTDDGRAVVFSSDRNGLFQLWRVRVGGGDPELVRSVPTRDPGGPAVAEGGRLVFEEWDFETDVWRAAPGRPPVPVVTSTWRDLQPHSAPDGRLAFASDRSGTWEIWTTGPGGEAPARLTSLGGPAALQPRWSPDGRRLAFEVRDAGSAGIFVADADGGIPRRVTPRGMDAVVPRWSRDGTTIYFSSRRTGRWEVWSVALDGSDPQQVTENGGYAAEELADGRLAYSKYGAPGLYARDRSGGAESVLRAGLSPVDGTNWWVDGDHLILPARGAEGVRLLRVDATTSLVEQVPVAIEHIAGGASTLAQSPGGGVLYTRIMRVEADIVVAEPFDGR